MQSSGNEEQQIQNTMVYGGVTNFQSSERFKNIISLSYLENPGVAEDK